VPSIVRPPGHITRRMDRFWLYEKISSTFYVIHWVVRTDSRSDCTNPCWFDYKNTWYIWLWRLIWLYEYVLIWLYEYVMHLAVRIDSWYSRISSTLGSIRLYKYMIHLVDLIIR
jgi:hypothetical protein